MKKVIFICLLSISTCLSRPEEAPNSTPTAPNPQTPPQTPPQSLPPQPPSTVPAHKEDATISDTKNKTAPVVNEGTAPPVPPVVPANETKTATDTNKTTDKNETTKPSDTTKNETSTQPSAQQLTPENKPAKPTTDHTVKNETTTLKPVPTPKSSEAPKATDKPPLQARGFDGPSFIGGIILTLGLLAIGFMGFKYYKNQTERNYHTL